MSIPFLNVKGTMTREFSKQRRDRSDERPPMRNQPPRRNSDERTSRPSPLSRPPRPRLSREMVDRGWESGAQQQHADYRPRNPNQRPRYQQGNTGSSSTS